MAVTPTPSITPLPPFPQRQSDTAAVFVTKADNHVAALPTFADEVKAVGEAAEANAGAAENAAAAAEAEALALRTATAALVLGNAYAATSNSPQTLTTGAKSFTLNETARAFQVGDKLVAFSRGNPGVRLKLTVDSYSGTTLGATVPSGGVFGSGGPYSDWAILPSEILALPPAGVDNTRAGLDGYAVTPKDLDDADATSALTDASTVAWNMATQGPCARLTMTSAVGGTRQLGAPTNGKDNKVGVVYFKQPATGGPCSATFSGYFEFPPNVVVSWSTAANAEDTLVFVHIAATGKGRVLSFTKGS